MYREIANASLSTGLLRKYDPTDEVCEGDCGEPIPNGEAYECGPCGQVMCEDCLMNDQYGMRGYRGGIDDGPDLDPLFDSGAVWNAGTAVCGQCMSQGQERYEEILEEREEEMREMREEEEESRREAEEQRKNFYGYGSQEGMDRAIQDRLQGIGDNMRRDREAMGRGGFSRDFQEKNASEDKAFRSAWDVVKGKKRRCDDCRCTLGDGTCSECIDIQRKEGRYGELYRQ